MILAIDANWRRSWMAPEQLKLMTFSSRRIQSHWGQYQETNRKLWALAHKGYKIEMTHDDQPEGRLF